MLLCIADHFQVRAPISVSAPIHFAIDMNNDTSVLVSWNHTDAHMIDSYIVRYWPTIRRFGDEKVRNLFVDIDVRKLAGN